MMIHGLALNLQGLISHFSTPWPLTKMPRNYISFMGIVLENGKILDFDFYSNNFYKVE